MQEIEGKLGKLEPAVLEGTPKRPDVTLAQKIAMVPIVAEFLHAWGVFTMSAAQQDSLQNVLYGAIALFGADAIIRFGRNLARR